MILGISAQILGISAQRLDGVISAQAWPTKLELSIMILMTQAIITSTAPPGKKSQNQGPNVSAH